MVCLGNICRSPMAEGILKERANEAGLKWMVDSAGTNGFHLGEAPHPLSQKVALIHGIDIRKQRARKFVGEDFDRFDKIYSMAPDVLYNMQKLAGKKFDPRKADLLMNEVYPGKNLEVPDPWSGPETEYEYAFELISQACEAIIAKALSGKIKTY